MSLILDLEKLLVAQISANIDLPIYSNIPDEVPLPFIRLGEISYNKGYICPETICAKCTVSVFSEEPSNREALNIDRKIRETISEIDIAKFGIISRKYISSEVFQLKNGLWCADSIYEFEILCEDSNA